MSCVVDEVMVKRWCDLCFVTEVRTEAVQRFDVNIAMEGRHSLPRQVDCCEQHREQIQELSGLVRSVGVVKRDSPVLAEDRCPVCGEHMHPKSVINHLVAAHGGKVPRQLGKCPDCGFQGKGGQGMILHRRRAHNYDHRMAVLETVKVRGKGK